MDDASLGTKNLRIVVLAYGHALSHVSRPLLVAEQLRRRGHTVIFAGTGRELQHAGNQGFAVRSLVEIPYEVLFGRIRNRTLRFIQTPELRRLVAADIRLLEELRPDLVLSDGRIGARISTQAVRVPHAAIVNVSSTRYRAIPYVPLLPPCWSGRATAWMTRINLRLEMAIFNAAVPAFRLVSRHLGLPPQVTATNCLEGNDATFLPDIEEFMPTRNLPESHCYVGPLVLGSDFSPPSWWSELNQLRQQGRRLIYVTMGSTGMQAVVPRLLNILDRLPDTMPVIATGGQPWQGRPDRHAFVADYLDGDAVMRLADAVICHGGNGTVYQAMTNGTFIIGLPAIPDQAYNMRRVEDLKLGTTLDPGSRNLQQELLAALQAARRHLPKPRWISLREQAASVCANRVEEIFNLETLRQQPGLSRHGLHRAIEKW